MKVTRQDVISAFRLLLGRDPEPAAQRYFLKAASLDALRQEIMKSSEFIYRFMTADVNASPFTNFHHIHTLRMTARRQEHLATLGLDIHNRSVLEVGAGIGLHSTFFLDRGCTVKATDGRPENLSVMQAIYQAYAWYPRRDALTFALLDIEDPQSADAGIYDIVYCYGLLYHCARPDLAIANMRRLCGDLLLIETSVEIGSAADLHVGSEDAAIVSQSIHGGGSHPHRAWLMDELRKHFGHVGIPLTQPNHELFPIDWTSPERFSNQTMRTVIVASDSPLPEGRFASDLPDRQERAP
jgi:SAM-dependent methyltransferase